MSHLCLSNFRHDIRLIYQLKSYELRHFLILLDYAGDRRDPTFIPVKKREEIRLILGFGSSEKERARLEARLRHYHDLDLIQLYDDGSILMAYRIDQDDDEEDAGEFRPAPAQERGGGSAAPSSLNGNGTHSQNGSSQPRSSHRKRSGEPEAVRKREYRMRRNEAGDGPAAPHGEGLAASTGNGLVAPESDILRDNVPSGESKCPRPAGTLSQNVPAMSQANVPFVPGPMSHSMSQNGRDIPGTSLARVSPNVNVSGEEDNKIISDSGDVINVAPKKMSQMSHGEMSQNVPGAPSARVPVRAGFEEVDANVQRAKDVDSVVRLAKDSKSRGYYIAAWKHCYAHSALDCWDMAVEMLTERIAAQAKHNYPPEHRDYLPPDAYGKSFNTTLGNLLRDNGTPCAQGTAAERAEVKAVLAAVLAQEAQPPSDVEKNSLKNSSTLSPVGAVLDAGSSGAALPTSFVPLDAVYSERDVSQAEVSELSHDHREEDLP